MITGDRLRVAVVGCGIGGPAAALFLARAGHTVTVFERAEELGPTGAGILVAPTGQYVLEKLGLLKSALAHGSRIQRLEGHTSSGRKIMDLRYRNLATGLFGLGVHRGTLFSLLAQALEQEGIEIRTGSQVASINDGRIVYAGGKSEGPFDLIVLADGARSTLRQSLGLGVTRRPYDYGALWVSATNWGEIPDNVLRQSYRGTKTMGGLLPSGRLPGADGRLVSLFWSICLAEVLDWRSRGLEEWKREVLTLMPGTESLLSQIREPEQVTVASYFDARSRQTAKGRCVAIGDAAHASSPQLGQGASLALFDAFILAQCVARETNVEVALLEYQRQREQHVKFYQLASKWMTPLFQSGHSYLAWPRDLLMGPINRIPWVQREMVATMCGIKEGPFRNISQTESVLHMGAKFAFGSMVKEESDSKALLRW